MRLPGTGRRLFAAVLACLALLLSTTMAWAAANDFRLRDTVPMGVTVDGHALGGLTRAEAREVIRDSIESPLLKPLTVTSDGRAWTFDPAKAVDVDVDAMLDEALSTRTSAPLLGRLTLDLGRRPVSAKIEPRYTVDAAVLDDWVETVASQVDRPAVDATVTLDDNTLTARHAEEGLRIDRQTAAAAIEDALTPDESLSGSNRTIPIVADRIQPKVTDDDLGKTIVVDLSERRVRLFDGGTLEKQYRCAVGTPAHPTPRGKFEIVNKRFMPTWRNPGSAWAKSMPAYIAPGPTNPLGTRALDLNAPSIRIHGTTKIGSIGTAASHGCMRMVRQDIEDLYPRVPVGTTVYIVM